MNEIETVLVSRARSGDRSAFEELIRRCSGLLFARFYVDTGCRHRAEDLVQEALLLASRSLQQLKEPADFRSWLLALARNVFIDDAKKMARLKRRVSSGVEESVEIIPSFDPSPHEAAEREEMRQQVLTVLRTLPEEYRLPIALRYILGLDSDAIGRHLGSTNSAVRSLVYRGLKLLRERLPQGLKESFEWSSAREKL